MKRTILCILIVLTIGIIGVLGFYQYNNLDSRKEEGVIDVTDSSSLALILIDENGNETNTDTFPSSGEYYLNFAKSYCENGSLIGWDSTSSKVRIIASKSDNCKLYFNKGTGAVNPKEDILASNTLVTTTPNFSAVATDANTNIYQAEDDLGISYYFRGAATQNYVYFGGFYWRIVRVNGDGTIRMIYDGTSAVDNGIAHDSVIEYDSYFPDIYNDAGYTYNTSDNDSTQKDSKVKAHVDEWYDENLKSNFEKFIADTMYCSDREISYSGNYIAYTAMDRTNFADPKLTCTQQNDKYTVSKNIGNGYLINPIGLITTDEIMFAGGVWTEPNNKFYLYNGDYYWTMTLESWASDDIYIIELGDDGAICSGDAIGDPDGIRPVINLRADLLFTGSGAKTDPYKVAGFE